MACTLFQRQRKIEISSRGGVQQLSIFEVTTTCDIPFVYYYEGVRTCDDTQGAFVLRLTVTRSSQIQRASAPATASRMVSTFSSFFITTGQKGGRAVSTYTQNAVCRVDQSAQRVFLVQSRVGKNKANARIYIRTKKFCSNIKRSNNNLIRPDYKHEHRRLPTKVMHDLPAHSRHSVLNLSSISIDNTVGDKGGRRL